MHPGAAPGARVARVDFSLTAVAERVLVGFLKSHRGSPPAVPTAAGGCDHFLFCFKKPIKTNEKTTFLGYPIGPPGPPAPPGPLGPQLAPTWPTWSHLVRTWAPLGPHLVPLGPLLGPTWPPLGPIWSRLGPDLVPPGPHLVPNWSPKHSKN